MNQSDRYRVAWVDGVPVIRDAMNGMWTQPFFNRRPGGVQENARLLERRVIALNRGLYYHFDCAWYRDGNWGCLDTSAVGHV